MTEERPMRNGPITHTHNSPIPTDMGDPQQSVDLSKSKTLVANSGAAAVITALFVIETLREAGLIRDAVVAFLPFETYWVQLVAYAAALGFVFWSSWRRIDDARRGKR